MTILTMIRKKITRQTRQKRNQELHARVIKHQSLKLQFLFSKPNQLPQVLKTRAKKGKKQRMNNQSQLKLIHSQS